MIYTSFNVIVIEQTDYEWQTIFEQPTVKQAFQQLFKETPTDITNNRMFCKVQVYQTAWEDITVGPVNNFGEEHTRCPCSIRKLWKNGEIEKEFKIPMIVFPDAVIIRNIPPPTELGENKILGFLYGEIPAVNSLESIVMCSQRPVMMAALNRLRRAHPSMRVIPEQFITSHRAFGYSQCYPGVVKFGSAHAGAGKMRIMSAQDMEDVRTTLTMVGPGYCVLEGFIRGIHDLRLQKIGNTYRAFKRTSTDKSWKTNTGACEIDIIEVLPRYKEWMDAACVLFGEDLRLDISTVDVLVTEDGSEYILEVNDSASGLLPEVAFEDNTAIALLLMEKMKAVWQRKAKEIKESQQQQQGKLVNPENIVMPHMMRERCGPPAPPRPPTGAGLGKK
eukprot:PhF_6_TR4382/c0_g1_i1/m.5912/K19941/SYN; synapsin